MTTAGKKVRQLRAKLPGGEIGEAPNLIERFVGRPGGHNAAHGVKIATASSANKIARRHSFEPFGSKG